MNSCFDFEGCENGYVIYQGGQKIKPHELIGLLNSSGQADNQMPEWVQHFLVHFVKRSAKMLITWIDDAKDAKFIDRKGKDSHIRLK